jgi:hypothetical protein
MSDMRKDMDDIDIMSDFALKKLNFSWYRRWSNKAIVILLKSMSFEGKSGLTMRAADKWESARFLSFSLALSFFYSQTLSTLRPHAANASR